MRSIVIAAPHSGSGKTTVTLGVMECLKRRGLRVAPFKVGPDFIDPGYHRLVTGRPSANLDGWMCGADFVQETFRYHAEGADIAVIEGAMGLFDGAGGTQEAGSTAQIAKIVGAEVLLVVDAKSQARSAAALVKGFAEFDPGLRVSGVIFNNVASENHARVLREAVEALGAGIRVVGCLPSDERLQIPSRHLGLLTAEENPLPEEFLDHLAEVVRGHLDLDLLWQTGIPPVGASGRSGKRDQNLIPIAVARDAAFCFVYEDNLRLLREGGAKIIEFSPLFDTALPAGIAGIYLPGGYPELFAGALAANAPLRGEIREAIEDGMPVYAECGGFIYLTEGIMEQVSTLDKDARCQGLTPLVGIFPVATRMLPRRKALGYREVALNADSILGRAGTVARGHEFHYSETDELPAEIDRTYRVGKGGVALGPEGYRYRNCLASYIHLHFGSSPGMAAAFVASCRNYHLQATRSLP